MRVLFWGTPDFALPPLRALLGEGFDVVGVVTQPDRAIGRSRSILEPPPVKRVAAAEAIPVLQPDRPRGDDFVAQLRDLAPDVSVVVAYGHILPQAIIDLPPRGTINIHASLLPLLRGAAPIEATIREGHAETGVTIMRMVKALDAGPSIVRCARPSPTTRPPASCDCACRARSAGVDRGARAHRVGSRRGDAARRVEGDLRAENRSRHGARRLDDGRGDRVAARSRVRSAPRSLCRAIGRRGQPGGQAVRRARRPAASIRCPARSSPSTTRG